MTIARNVLNPTVRYNRDARVILGRSLIRPPHNTERSQPIGRLYDAYLTVVKFTGNIISVALIIYPRNAVNRVPGNINITKLVFYYLFMHVYYLFMHVLLFIYAWNGAIYNICRARKTQFTKLNYHNSIQGNWIWWIETP